MTTLEEQLAAIQGYDDPRRASSQWKQVYRLLEKADVDPQRFQRIVGMRDVAGLAALIEQLASDTAQGPSTQGDGARAPPVHEEALAQGGDALDVHLLP